MDFPCLSYLRQAPAWRPQAENHFVRRIRGPTAGGFVNLPDQGSLRISGGSAVCPYPFCTLLRLATVSPSKGMVCRVARSLDGARSRFGVLDVRAVATWLLPDGTTVTKDIARERLLMGAFHRLAEPPLMAESGALCWLSAVPGSSSQNARRSPVSVAPASKRHGPPFSSERS